MFRANTAQHQEPKTALAASGFAYVVGCLTCSCWTLTASSNYTSNNPPRMHCCILLDFLCELYYDARIHEHQVNRFNFLHQCMPSVAQPERLAILRNTKPDIHQRIRLLLFAIITNFLYQPIFRYCLEIICRTIENSGVGFPPETKDIFYTGTRTPLAPIRVAISYRVLFLTRYNAWAWGRLLHSYCQVEEYVELYSHSSVLLCGIHLINHKENVIHCFYRGYFLAGKVDRLISLI